MASSSVSQESLDIDFEKASRQSRIRAQRAAKSTPTHTARPSIPAELISNHLNSKTSQSSSELTPTGKESRLHESPSPNRGGSATRSSRDKRVRPSNLHKGKLAKDKRKLREKRRSTGVVQHFPSTESTGDSLDDDDHLPNQDATTKRNTRCNEIIDADNPQTPEEGHRKKSYVDRRQCKSPSDLEADLEDNQDYDSTISQSESNLTNFGHSRLLRSSSSSCSSVNKIQNRNTESSPIPSREPEIYAKLKLKYADEEGNDIGQNNCTKANILNGQMESGPNTLITIKDLGRPKRDASEARLQKRILELEKQLEVSEMLASELRADKCELEAENVWLHQTIADRDHKVAQLEKEIHLIHQDLEFKDDDNRRMQRENQTLLRAIKALSVL